MASRHELEQTLSELLAVDRFKDYCPNGLQVEGKKEIQSIALAVTADLPTIEKAVTLKADALIVHHGLFWRGDSFVVKGAKRRKLHLLLEHDISLFAYHLPLDAHSTLGNNWKAAADLGWKDCEPFGEMNGASIGVQGRFASQSVSLFIAELEAYYGHSAHAALGGNEEVSSAALISGGAWRDVRQAAEQGVDCFITGNFDEPAWTIAHEEGIHFIAMGHTATERIGVRALGDHLASQFHLQQEFIDTPNPF